ncbi:pol polyprotein [Pseudoloma neurophilia]|uniref:Pol polyprotein n=1 Tax=Pseudoloma neurophilia TaxID=146866 RepID=A0A0R0M5S2_9MICR|nr:pol polyprotein [Pseudoloma neurophilia]
MSIKDTSKDENKSNRENTKSKWCRYHKRNTHDSSECVKLKKKHDERTEYTKGIKPSNEQSSGTKKKMFISSQNYKCHPNVEGTIGNKSVQILLDTGADDNYISSALLNHLNLKPQTTEPKEIFFGNSDSVIVDKSVDITFKTINTAEKVHSATFFVINSKRPDILLGTKWLKENNVIIDFVTGEINFSKDICLPNILSNVKLKSDDFNNPDIDQDEFNQKILILVNKFKTINPSLGKIVGFIII